MTWVFVAAFCLAGACGEIREPMPSGNLCTERAEAFVGQWPQAKEPGAYLPKLPECRMETPPA